MEDLFEEVVGDIEEPDGLVSQAQIYRDEEGLVYVDGALRLPEVGEEFGVELEHEEVDSVSGLVLLLLGRPAEIGDTVEYETLRFEVTAILGHGVDECRVTPLPDPASPAHADDE
jgi:CBS domain containing-hemolysin-like protein